MPSVEDLIGSGCPPSLALRLGEMRKGTISALGAASQADAHKCINSINHFTTVTAGAADSTQLPNASTFERDMLLIRNDGAGTLKVFPAVGQKINNAAANASIDVAAASGKVFMKIANDQWVST